MKNWYVFFSSSHEKWFADKKSPENDYSLQLQKTRSQLRNWLIDFKFSRITKHQFVSLIEFSQVLLSFPSDALSLVNR